MVVKVRALVSDVELNLILLFRWSSNGSLLLALLVPVDLEWAFCPKPPKWINPN